MALFEQCFSSVSIIEPKKHFLMGMTTRLRIFDSATNYLLLEAGSERVMKLRFVRMAQYLCLIVSRFAAFCQMCVLRPLVCISQEIMKVHTRCLFSNEFYFVLMSVPR